MTEAFHWRKFRVSRTRFSVREATNRILKQVNGSEISMYSMLGAELANVWLAEYADEDGYIRKVNKSQYSLVEQACTGILTKEGIAAASDFLRKVLASDRSPAKDDLPLTVP